MSFKKKYSNWASSLCCGVATVLALTACAGLSDSAWEARRRMKICHSSLLY